jgi:hypothetical protein
VAKFAVPLIVPGNVSDYVPHGFTVYVITSDIAAKVPGFPIPPKLFTPCIGFSCPCPPKPGPKIPN